MKIRTLLDELDGAGIVVTDLDETMEYLHSLGRSIEDILIPLRPSELQTLRDSLTALQVLGISNCDEFIQDLAEKSLELIINADSESL